MASCVIQSSPADEPVRHGPEVNAEFDHEVIYESVMKEQAQVPRSLAILPAHQCSGVWEHSRKTWPNFERLQAATKNGWLVRHVTCLIWRKISFLVSNRRIKVGEKMLHFATV